MNYARAEYRFFDDHLELEEGFFSVNKKEIRYSDVKEITLHKGFFQRMCGLGTIYLATWRRVPRRNRTPSAPLDSATSPPAASASATFAIPTGYERIRAVVNPHR